MQSICGIFFIKSINNLVVEDIDVIISSGQVIIYNNLILLIGENSSRLPLEILKKKN